MSQRPLLAAPMDLCEGKIIGKIVAIRGRIDRLIELWIYVPFVPCSWFQPHRIEVVRFVMFFLLLISGVK
jgi:hypothetical protein